MLLANAPLRASVLRAAGFGMLVVTSVALVTRAALDLSRWYPGKAATFFAAMMVTVLVFIDGYHPHPQFGAANHVTMARAMLLALVVCLIGEAARPVAGGFAVIAATLMMTLDGVDGWLARRSRTTSVFGARFDMETDALLVMAMSILVWQHEKAGGWVLAGGLMRYLFVAAGWLLPWMAQPLRPTRRARVITICHGVGLSLALAPFVRRPLSAWVVAGTLAALTWSFAVDVRRLWRGEGSWVS